MDDNPSSLGDALLDALSAGVCILVCSLLALLIAGCAPPRLNSERPGLEWRTAPSVSTPMER